MGSQRSEYSAQTVAGISIAKFEATHVQWCRANAWPRNASSSKDRELILDGREPRSLYRHSSVGHLNLLSSWLLWAEVVRGTRLLASFLYENILDFPRSICAEKLARGNTGSESAQLLVLGPQTQVLDASIYMYVLVGKMHGYSVPSKNFRIHVLSCHDRGEDCSRDRVKF